jgi:hypothetical protein
MAMWPPILAGVGERERRLDAGDPAAHDQRLGVDLDPPRLQRLVQLDAPHRSADERPALVGGRLLVLVDPRVVLPDVDHLEEEGVQASLRRRGAEGLLVQAGRARGDHDSREAVVADVLLDQLLPWVGAHVLVLPRDHDSRQLGGVLRQPLDVDGARDVGAAVANEDPDPLCTVTVLRHRSHSSFERG